MSEAKLRTSTAIAYVLVSAIAVTLVTIHNYHFLRSADGRSPNDTFPSLVFGLVYFGVPTPLCLWAGRRVPQAVLVQLSSIAVYAVVIGAVVWDLMRYEHLAVRVGLMLALLANVLNYLIVVPFVAARSMLIPRTEEEPSA